MPQEKIVVVHWNSKESIRKAEQKKLKLENDGYTQSRTVTNSISETTTLFYIKPFKS